MSILTGLVIVVAMATLAQKSDQLLDTFFGEDTAGIAPQNDSVTVVAGRPEIIDVLSNDENVAPDDAGGVRILVSPSCGAAETADNGILYISNESCLGDQLFAYCVQRGDDCTSASVNVKVVSALPAKPVVGAQQQAGLDDTVAPIEVIPTPDRQPETSEIAPLPENADEDVVVAAQTPEASGGVAAAVTALAPTTPQIAQLGRSPSLGSGVGDAALLGLSGDEPAIRAEPAATQQAPIGPVGGTAPSAGERVARLTLPSNDAVSPRPAAPSLSGVIDLPGAPHDAPQSEGTVVARVSPAAEDTDTRSQIQSDVVAAIDRQPEALPTRPSVAPQTGPTPVERPIARGCGVAEMVSRRGTGANTLISIVSSCRANEPVTLSHAGLEFAAQFDNTGRLKIELPVMDIDSGVVAIFGDEGRAVTPINYDERSVDLALRVAVAWTTPVDLDLHVFEYAAGFGADGHVWQQNPRAFRDVRRAGGGYLSSFPAKTVGGQSIEVYTFWANSRARPGFARIALDHASRGDTPNGDFCGSGVLAAPDYQVVRTEFGVVTSRSKGRFSPAACGVSLASDARYANGAVKDLEIVGR